MNRNFRFTVLEARKSNVKFKVLASQHSGRSHLERGKGREKEKSARGS
jgi:hypothetical protein